MTGVGAAVASVAAPVFAGTAEAWVSGAPGRQTEWAFCSKCTGLYYFPRNGISACPAGGRHDNYQYDSGNYFMYYNITTTPPDLPAGAGLQANWAYCSKCTGLYYFPKQGISACPAGGRHDNDNNDSYNYTLVWGPTWYWATSGLVPQPGWNWCSKCQGLYYFPYQGRSACPAGGRHDNNSSDSQNYIVSYSTTRP